MVTGNKVQMVLVIITTLRYAAFATKVIKGSLNIELDSR